MKGHDVVAEPLFARPPTALKAKRMLTARTISDGEITMQCGDIEELRAALARRTQTTRHEGARPRCRAVPRRWCTRSVLHPTCYH